MRGKGQTMNDWRKAIAGLVGTALVAVPLGVIAVLGIISGGGTSSEAKTPGTAAQATGGSSFTVELGDIWIKPSDIEVKAGETYELVVTNTGTVPHDLVLDESTAGTDMLNNGDSQTLTFIAGDKNLVFYCSVPGHRQAGMELTVKVEGAAEDAPVHVSAENGDYAVIDPNAAPADGWKPYDPALQPAPGGTEHQVTLRATETIIEVAPGVTQELWTFNDMVPGPVLRGKVGDIFTVTLVNEGVVGHSIDFHSSKVAWNDEMRTIGPGESLVYQYEARHSGIFMYHCGTAPALHHIGNGMFGAIIIDPPDLPEVDHEFVFVQSEYYLGPEGEVGDLDKMMNEEWDAVVFNGYFNQYLHAPIRVETGERVRAWVLDAGPSENSSFHIVGTIFDTVYKEGAYRLQPGPEQGGAQALDLQPAQGGFVEFTFDEDGLYPIVTHKFSNVGKGALGLFQAGEVDAAGAGGH
jgi:nitrite reductase (NO-forming)